MPQPFMKKLSSEINIQARRHAELVLRDLPELPKELLEPYETLPPNRRPLRLPPTTGMPNRPPYRYSFHESDEMYPTGADGLMRVIRAGRNEALNAIHAPVRTGRVNEHAWLWVPSEGLWIDATIEPAPDYVTYDYFLHAYLSHAFGDVDMLHTHPAPVPPHILDKGGTVESWLLDSALPSGRDLKLLSNMQAVCPPDASLSGSIVSYYGATRYTLGTPPGRYHDFSINGRYEQHVTGNPLEPTLAIREALADLAVRSHFIMGGGNAFITSFNPLPAE
jgi:hypothetical protein